MQEHNVGRQFHYQLPIPGLEKVGANPQLPVEQLFKHPQINHHPAEYQYVNHTNYRVRAVATSALRPTQPHVNEGYLYDAPKDSSEPAAIKDGSGRYRLVDGHHRVARALLAGEKRIPVKVFSGRPF